MQPNHPIFTHYNPISVYELTQDKLVASVFVTYTILQLVSFWYVTKHYPSTFAKNTKASAWFLTWMCSIPVCAVAIPFGVEILWKENPAFTINVAGYTVASLFLSFLFVDLVVGAIYYPKRVNLVAGWVHHIVYIIILVDFLTSGVPGLLGPFCVLEFPTFLLAIGNISPKWRTDKVFGAVFFTTRIAYHAFFIFKYYQFCFGYRYFFYVAGVFPMHCLWFYQWTQSFLRKQKQKTA